ncbi:hypothetical protein WA158_002470 [Blastocystis sp. Blastoise]
MLMTKVCRIEQSSQMKSETDTIITLIVNLYTSGNQFSLEYFPIRLVFYSSKYPTFPPLVTVPETNGLLINPECRYIVNNQFELDCLKQWSHPRSSLAGIIREVNRLIYDCVPYTVKTTMKKEEAMLTLCLPIEYKYITDLSPLLSIPIQKKDLLYKSYYNCHCVYVRQPYLQSRDLTPISTYISRLAQISHPNITSIYASMVKEDKFYYIYEYIDASLPQYIKDYGEIPARELGKITLDVCRALRYLHSSEPTPLLHMDLKLENIVVDETGRCKLTHFYIPLFISSPASTVTKSKPSEPLNIPIYLVPLSQMSSNNPEYNSASEIYMFAALIYELFTGETYNDFYKRIKNPKKRGDKELLGDKIPECVRNTLYKIWKPIEDRINIYDLYEDILNWKF